MLSELYSPDDVHALPGINLDDDDQRRSEEEETYDDEANSTDDRCEGQDTAVALKVHDLHVDRVVFG